MKMKGLRGVLDEAGNMAGLRNTGPRTLCWRRSEIKSGTDKGDPDNDPESSYRICTLLALTLLALDGN